MKFKDTKNLVNGLNQRIKSLEAKINQLDKALQSSYYKCLRCGEYFPMSQYAGRLVHQKKYICTECCDFDNETAINNS